ncbi:hypothetical protein NQZ68_022231 [Dissostichus eleginoides]|nr:hypothetical protein NQZ68_022231 [Dissostichus eleginoides]
MTSEPFFSSLNTVFAITIIAPFKTSPSEKAFLFFTKKRAALNEASVAFCDFFTGLVKKDCCFPKAAFNSQAFSARSALQGVPGVKPERYEEGLAVKHCALSLVGEPIMYPEINTFIRLLHTHHISSFLVTNAQFPEEIRSLVPVTQLYVSVDASTKDSLKRIDRPLFKDFWPRFLDSLRALGEKESSVGQMGDSEGLLDLGLTLEPSGKFIPLHWYLIISNTASESDR